MHKIKGFVGVALIASTILLTGCEEKLDASSPRVLEASIKEVSAKLKPVEKAKFDEALQTVIQYNFAVYGINGGIGDEGEKSVAKMLSGKTASDVIDMAPDLNKKMEEIHLEQKKKAELAAIETQKNNEELRKKNRIIQLNSMISNGESEIIQIQENAKNAVPRLETLESERAPYAEAAEADKNGLFKVENIKIQATDGNKGKDRVVSLDLVNNSSFSINQMSFNIEYFLDGDNRIARNSQEINFEKNLEPKGVYHFELNYNRPGLTISKYPAEAVTAKVQFTSIQNTVTGVNVSSDINKTGWKKEAEYLQLTQIIKNEDALVSAKKAAIESFKSELNSLR